MCRCKACDRPLSDSESSYDKETGRWEDMCNKCLAIVESCVREWMIKDVEWVNGG